MELLHATARLSVQWMFYCLMEGTILAVFAWILLRLLPRQNSGTRFALWFSVMLATIVLPFITGAFFKGTSAGAFSTSSKSRITLVTVTDSFALVIFGLWALTAGLALLRVFLALWQVNRIRRNSEEVDLAGLDVKVRTILETFPRTISLCVSDKVQVPAAIGFLRPSVVMPRWLLQEISPEEFQQVLLHELTHLRRRDDWTNLAQKIVKALLFFHPSVWWLEQRLSLEREMACDEAVVVQSGTPHTYAQCLTRLAERTLIKRKMALAQSMVSRMRQLSLRVAQILDANHPGTTRIWKPAVPLVMAAAAICGLSAWQAPALVAFQDEPPSIHSHWPAEIPRPLGADLRLTAVQPKLVLAGADLTAAPPRETSKAVKLNRNFTARKRPQSPSSGDYVVRADQFVVAVTGYSGTGQPMMWRVSMWQVRIPVSAGDHAGKTASRKNI